MRPPSATQIFRNSPVSGWCKDDRPLCSAPRGDSDQRLPDWPPEKWLYQIEHFISDLISLFFVLISYCRSLGRDFLARSKYFTDFKVSIGLKTQFRSNFPFPVKTRRNLEKICSLFTTAEHSLALSYFSQFCRWGKQNDLFVDLNNLNSEMLKLRNLSAWSLAPQTIHSVKGNKQKYLIVKHRKVATGF